MLNKEIIDAVLDADTKLTDEQIDGLSKSDLEQLSVLMRAAEDWRKKQNDIFDGLIQRLEQALPAKPEEESDAEQKNY